jgi:hypothetical protein
MTRWTVGLALSLALTFALLLVDRATSANETCVLRFDRSEVDVVRGELRIDLRNKFQRECRGLDISNLRLDRATVELRDDADRSGSRNDRDYRPGRRRGDTFEVYLFTNGGGQHRVSDDPSDGQRFGYGTNEGPRFSLFRKDGRNRAPIYSCFVDSRNDHFVSTRSDCEGFTVERQLGFVAVEEEDGTVPLYRCYNKKRHDHLATTDQNECAAIRSGVEMKLGYVP